MTGARMSTLASLRKTIGRIEGETDGLVRVALGHTEADATLHGGLVRGALHEVFAEGDVTLRRQPASSQDLPIVWRVDGHSSGCGRILRKLNPGRCRSEVWLSWGWTRAYWSSSEPRMPRRRSV